MLFRSVSHDGQTDFSFTVHRNELDKALDVLKSKVQAEIQAKAITGAKDICKVSVVGIGMRSHVGIASQMFETLSKEGINIQMISTSEIKISVVIDDKYMELAVRALQLLSQNLMRACDNGHDLAAREAMLLGAMFAGQSFANSPVAAVHALAYPIGGIFHVAHGLSNALVLPHVMKFNAPAACKRYAELCDGVLPGTTGSDETKTAALIAHIEGLIEATGIPRTLREVGVKQADLSRMASDAMLQTRLLVNNPREVTEADAFAIYSAAF